MNELTLVKSANFGEVQTDIYSRDGELFMTSNQLCDCLEETRNAFDVRISRNPYLKEKEFSVSYKMQGTDGKLYSTRVFTEDGIYEIAMLSESEKAKDFRAWIRKLLKALRKGEAKIISMTEYQQKSLQIREAQLYERLARQCDGTYRQVLHAYSTKALAGEFLLPLPQLPEKTLSATEVGQRLGITKQMVGILANRHNLKTDEYGALFNDKSPHSTKEVQSFRYYENVIPVLEAILRQQPAS